MNYYLAIPTGLLGVIIYAVVVAGIIAALGIYKWKKERKNGTTLTKTELIHQFNELIRRSTTIFVSFVGLMLILLMANAGGIIIESGHPEWGVWMAVGLIVAAIFTFIYLPVMVCVEWGMFFVNVITLACDNYVKSNAPLEHYTRSKICHVKTEEEDDW
jgi:nicotinamide riboside transporter PnuC